MELLRDILAKAPENETMRVEFPGPGIAKIVETRIYRALSLIRDTVRSRGTSDAECFERVEQIICALEEAGSGGGGRRDF